ncbi:uncharacterized protein (TIGR02246 family) [Christiangramia gaetbulicola]|uniref:Uncharacterized protein (TIGR02246 family) n=1 Tax=Christiangramia gaetbulicola TaxID=703340 RepID=A0A2T6AF61_9FLAO|nr:nuclear transport factor 2 family protein [Christiangramia gaetbulicola]PTX42416.1 uncharacterized protein (TIGR02246 family) [Christiangramia gaetbulicola]
MKKLMLLLFAAVLINFSVKAQNYSEVRSVIERNSRIMQKAMEDGDFDKFGSFFADDVIFKMSGQEALNGRDAVTAAHKPMAEQNMKLVIHTDEVLDFGDYANELGTYEIHTKEGQKVDHGRYSTLWKNVNGDWKIYRDFVSTSAGAGQP